MATDADAALSSGWNHICEQAPAPVKPWFTSAKPLALHGSTLVVAVPNDFSRERVAVRHREWIETTLAAHYGRPIQLAVSVDPSLEDELDTEDASAPALPLEVASHGLGVSAAAGFGPGSAPAPGNGVRLNPKYTFENFVIGSSNRFAHAAAVAVAEAPGKSYNPLMIYGPSGLGKTHLLHGIGHYVRQYLPQVRVKYVSTEELTNDFINAISENRTAEFRRAYRDIDVLLIDDIQFLESKIQTQEEFFHTFNTLHNAQKQIVMTSDRPPRLLEALEPRLRSRFEWGLLTDIQPPDLETRIAILRKKATAEHLSAPPEVLEFIADKIATNIRELEGALIRVTAFASLNQQPVELRLAEDVLRDLIPEGVEAQITPQLIMSQTATYFNISVDDLCGPARTHVLVTARQIAMYLCRELTDSSLPAIGRLFGGRDHTTVMHANKKIRTLMAERRTIYNQVTELTNRIKQAASAH
ncbi:MAG: chromosomal replication initiator protein DnaA [Propioniciclava sp.]|uniref:chromosomal replication initiator protein DnaA n=1 Tax=Propioniciclava sp. TaxID=2038686 RepID=UPI0039E6AE90